MRIAVFTGVVLHVALALLMLVVSAPLERLDAPPAATIALADPPGCAVPNPAFTACRFQPRPPTRGRPLVAGPHVTWSAEPPPPPPPQALQQFYSVAPTVLDAHRIRGTKQIPPTNSEREALLRNGIDRGIGVFKLCISGTGRIESVTTLKSTKQASYDLRIERALRTWMYRPYQLNGSFMAVCSVVTIPYRLDS